MKTQEVLCSCLLMDFNPWQPSSLNRMTVDTSPQVQRVDGWIQFQGFTDISLEIVSTSLLYSFSGMFSFFSPVQNDALKCYVSTYRMWCVYNYTFTNVFCKCHKLK